MSPSSDPNTTNPSIPADAAQRTSIREATRADAATIAEFNRSMALETENLTLEKDIIHAGVNAVFDKPDRGLYLCAEQAGHVVGCLMLTREWSDWRNAEFWWIQSVYVAPASRKQGVYQQLYGHAQNLARDRGGICGFRLYVEKNNTRAQMTYQLQGMQETHYLIYEQLIER